MAASKRTIAIVEDDASLRRALERLRVRPGLRRIPFVPRRNSCGSAVARVACVPDPRYSASGDVGFRVIRLSHLTRPGSGRRSSSPRGTRTACGSKRPGFPTVSSCASQLSASSCWRPSVRCSAAAVPIRRAPEHEAQCGESHFPLTKLGIQPLETNKTIENEHMIKSHE